jgi:hypothetical protein
LLIAMSYQTNLFINNEVSGTSAHEHQWTDQSSISRHRPERPSQSTALTMTRLLRTKSK